MASVRLSLRKAFALSWNLLRSNERRKVILLGLGMALNGLLQSFSLAAFIPFIAMLLDPKALETNRYLVFLHQLLNKPDPRLFFVWVGSGFFFLVFLQNLLQYLYTIFQNRLVAAVEKRVTVELFERCLAAPYVWFLSQNTAVLLKEIMGDVTVWARQCLKSILMMTSSAVSILCVLALLIGIRPAIGISLVIAGILITLVTLRMLRPFIRRMSEMKQTAIEEAYKVVSHALVGSKDVKISGRETFFVDQFAKQFQVITQNTAKVATVQVLPSSVIEVVIALAVILVSLNLPALSGGRSEMLTLLTVYGLGAVRLLPLFTYTTTTIASVQGAIPSVEAVHRTNLELAEFRCESVGKGDDVVTNGWASLKVENVVYRYPNSDRSALNGVSLQIPRGIKLGMVGRSGAGKSTLVDILTGLLMPTAGRLVIGDVELSNGNVRSWQRQIGYVPQAPFVADETLRFNVALGMERKLIDDQRVLQSLEAANFSETLRRELPDGLETRLGDRGMRLSGGQRQRVSIARALYHNPSLLILDEATNELDTENEHAIMESLNKLPMDKIIIIVTHRLSTVRNCDKIVVLDEGKILGVGDHDHLIASCPLYKHLVELGDTSQG